MLFFSSFKYTLIIWIVNLLLIFPQNNNEISNCDSIKNIILNEVTIASSRFNIDSKVNYYLLRYRVLKVYPFLDSIQKILNDADMVIESLDKKKFTRRYTRKVQKKIINQFSTSISNLTRKEGVILSKLVYREFDTTVYDLIYQYRGGLQAFLWYKISKIYDGDLKIIFSPSDNVEDFYIDKILNQEFGN